MTLYVCLFVLILYQTAKPIFKKFYIDNALELEKDIGFGHLFNIWCKRQ